MELVFRDDPYRRDCEAKVVSVGEAGIRLDRTVFYPMGGGQPGDIGVLRVDGREIAIADTRKGESHEDVVHVPVEGMAPPAPGAPVTAALDWDRRHRLMRMHTCLHLLCSAIVGDVTGGQIGDGKGRLDFNLPDTRLDKEAIAETLNRLIGEDHPVKERWIGDAEMEANRDLVRTLSVKPPSGTGRVRLVEIPGIDLQPSGGTHVASTSEIGPIRVGKIESKGKMNRRVNLLFES